MIEDVLNHKTLLDGFGEATDQVVALRTESTRLKAQVTSLVSENAHMRVNLAAKDQEMVVAFHEQKQLRAECSRLITALLRFMPPYAVEQVRKGSR